jgi:hypothetical protein
MVFATEWNRKCGLLCVFAERKQFLEEVAGNVRAHNVVLPPWDTFPRAKPFAGWNSAIEGAWLEQIWIPYWRGLGTEQKEKILRNAPPPKSWSGWDESLTWRFMFEE